MKGEDTGEAQKEEDHHHLQQQQQEKKVLLGGGEGNAETQAVRTSSCTKEEVDAILIQCGRLSRSTGGPSSPNDIACDGLNRRCSSSSGRERRRTPTTSRDASPSDHHHHHRKRSSSRERRPEDGGESKRASSGGRRVSRSPGKRTTDPTTNPAVAADHHVASSSSSSGTSSSVRTKSSMASGAAAGANRTSRSPRARSPARTARAPSDENAIPPPTTTATQPSLSRSSSRKAEQSPYRRYPLSEINDNTGAAEIPFAGSATSADNPMSQTLTRTRSLRKSRDLDNPASYASFLLEDIQNYHQQNTTFSLPACLSKACSILEAVADLNSSCSDNQISEQDHNNASLNVSRFGGRRMANKDLFVESGLHKYVSVRDLRGGEDMEQQESAGSNSYVSCHPWVSLREPNSADSTGRWFSQSNASDEEDEVGEEVDGLGPIHQRQPQKQLNQRVVVKAKSRHVSSSSSSSLPDVTANNTLSGSKKRESDNLHLNHHDSGASNRRAVVGSKVSACRVPNAASS
ncbi:hypothetical protein QJS04_geneDACA024800 [Acorus gramineus]|uniref:Uncharacterized protein n=1 Tax=Acorus gramineus TaxID=55184 RepID=A0AAV8ZYZ6_ACOGR|nr:hypothetical protein QJS04_geneDACA024800 [Acorus gramineus]